jgi:WD40 repeat protein/tetratricopeptide (TPR) repeat protein/predicted Ser/Thr protein kinase
MRKPYQCPRGHHWEVVLPRPDSAPPLCPQCGAAAETVTEHDAGGSGGRTAPPAGPEAGPAEWFVAAHKQKLGPFSHAALRALAAQGKLRPEDMVLRQGQGKWQPAREVPGLFAAPPPAPAPAAEPEPTFPVATFVAAADVPALVNPPAVPGYEVVGLLGKGGMGVVYKAIQVRLKRLVALKVMRGGGHADREDVERFRSEAEAVARMQHPNIVQIFEVGEHAGCPFFSMEFVDGGNLAGKVADNTVPPPEAARLVETLARAMHSMHRRGIIHRDMKPANVLLTADGVPKICDFGLAKRLDEVKGQTQTGAIVGTPSYMAPEQALGNPQGVGPLTDVYALGAILYEMLTGRPPFKGATVLETLAQVGVQDPVPPARLNLQVPRDLDTICLKCLEKSPARRYADAQALADDLGRFLAGQPILARPVGTAGRLTRWCRRNPLPASLVAAVALVLVTATVLSSNLAFQLSRKAEEALDNERLARANERQALANAAEARANAKRANAESEQARKNLLASRRNLYHGDMIRAARAWENSQVDLVLELLEAHKPKPGSDADVRGFEWYFLWRLCHADLETVRLRGARPGTVTLSPDGTHAAFARAGKLLAVRDLAGGKDVATYKGLKWGVFSLAAAPGGKRLAVVDQAAPNLGGFGGGFGGGIGGLAGFGGLGGFAGALGGEFGNPGGKPEPVAVRVWDASGLKTLREAKGVFLQSLTFSPDGTRLAAVQGSDVTVWDAAAGKEMTTIKPPPLTSRYISAVAFSPDGKRLAEGSFNIQVWDLGANRGAPVLTLEGDASSPTLLAFSPDGNYLAGAGGWQRQLTVWDARTGKKIYSRDVQSFVNRLAYSPDGKRLALGSLDKTIKVWEAVSGTLLRTFRGHEYGVESLAFSADGRTLTSADYDGTVKTWDIAHDQEGTVLQGGAGGFLNSAFSPDGRLLAASASFPQEVRVWDTATGKVRLTLKGPPGTFSQLAFSPHGKRLAAAWDKGLICWDTRSGKELARLTGHPGLARCVAFSPDGARAATGGGEWNKSGEVVVWDLQKKEERCRVTGFAGPVQHVAFRPDGKRLFVTGFPQTGKGLAVVECDAGTGRKITPFACAQDEGGITAVSADGKYIALARGTAGSKSYGVVVREAGTFRVRYRLPGHTSFLSSLAFSGDGKRLVSASSNELILWDMATGQEVMTSREPRGMFGSVALSRDGRRLAMPHFSGGFTIWLATEWDEAAKKARRARVADSRREWHEAEAQASEAVSNWFAAAFHLSRLLEGGTPANPAHHARRGAARVQLQQWDKAVADLTAAIQKGAKEQWVWGWRGYAHVFQGQWAQAKADFRKAVLVQPDEMWQWHNLAHLDLRDADAKGYRNTCARMLERLGNTTNPTVARDVAWLCALAPGGALETPKAPVKLAEAAVAKYPLDELTLRAAGASYYRDKRFADAVKQLEAACKRNSQGGTPTSWLFLAMAHHGLKQKQQATDWLTKAEAKHKEWADLRVKFPGSNPLSWDQQVELDTLLAEAKGLIRGK